MLPCAHVCRWRDAAASWPTWRVWRAHGAPGHARPAARAAWHGPAAPRRRSSSDPRHARRPASTTGHGARHAAGASHGAAHGWATRRARHDAAGAARHGRWHGDAGAPRAGTATGSGGDSRCRGGVAVQRALQGESCCSSAVKRGSARPAFHPRRPIPRLASPVQRMMDQFETLNLGAGGPGPSGATDITTLPRPAGPDRDRARGAPPPYDRGNCATHNMRPTVRGGAKGRGKGASGERRRGDRAGQLLLGALHGPAMHTRLSPRHTSLWLRLARPGSCV